MSNQAVFELLFLVSASKQVKWHCSHRKSIFFDEEYPKVTANMTGRDSGEFENLITKSDMVYRCTYSHIGIMPPIDYRELARGLESSRVHSAIVES